MGKAKKGKKVESEDVESFQDDQGGDEVPKSKAKKEKVKDVPRLSDSEEDSGKKKKPKKKKEENLNDSESEDESSKKKKMKKKKSVDVDETANELQQLSISLKKNKKKGKGGGDSEDEISRKKSVADSSEDEEKPAMKAKSKPAKGGFALLAVSDDESPERPQQPSDPEDEPEEPVKTKGAPAESKKGGKKSKKKKKDDEEDLDQILAELQMEMNGGVPPPAAVEDSQPPSKPAEETEEKKKKKKKEKEIVEPVGDVEVDEEGKTVKSAAQKRKEKKEREKQKKLAEKKDKVPSEKPSEEVPEEPEPVLKEVSDDEDGDEDDKKKKKKKKGAKEDKEKKGAPKKKVIAAMQEALKKIKEEEERLKMEEEERLKREEEAENARLEKIRLEQERRDRKKAKEKERKERLKAEGKLLSQKQKADRARAEAMIQAMKSMYVAPAAVPKPKPFTKLKKTKKEDISQEQDEEPDKDKVVEVKIVDAETEKEEESKEDVKDSWDAESGKEDEEDGSDESVEQKAPETQPEKEKKSVKAEESSSDEESSEEEESDESSEAESEDDERVKTDAEKKRERAVARIKQRQEDALKKQTLDELRAPVVCVLGHVDTGKTKILDKLRRTNVQDGEAGGITQQIGATNVPIDAIKEQAKIVKGFSTLDLKLPGLLIIDTPGHESFSNLRSRGSSLCDIAILVVDIMHGLEPQTIESLNLLKQRKTPFVVALNKIDRLYDWQTMSRRDVRDVIKAQAPNTQLEFEQRVNEVVLQFAEQGLNAALFYNNPDVRSYVSLVPTSAITGEGMGNLLAYIVESSQNMLAKRLMFSEELQATVLEVKAISGLGTTIDVILVNGWLREGDTIILAGTDAPIVTQIRSLLMPQPLKELRVKNAYVEYKEVKAAQGVKIAAKDLEKVIAGLNLRVAQKPDEVEILRDEVARELKHALSSIKLQERGVYVQASTLGSLEALLEFLRTSKIPYSGIRIGPVVKKDVMRASAMLEHDSQYATILAFDVKIERDAQDLADSLGVKIFQADIIYHLFDKFMAYRDELKQKKRDEFKSIAVFPCKLKILPQFIFNSRDPIVMGVMVEAGIVKEGTPLCVPSKEFVDIGIVTSIEVNHKTVETARKGQEVCVKIEPIPGEAPKMFGRHFDDKDFLVSKISRQSIDACKDYFRDDLVKTDWQLMVELKKLFQIL